MTPWVWGRGWGPGHWLWHVERVLTSGARCQAAGQAGTCPPWAWLTQLPFPGTGAPEAAISVLRPLQRYPGNREIWELPSLTSHLGVDGEGGRGQDQVQPEGPAAGWGQNWAPGREMDFGVSVPRIEPDGPPIEGRGGQGPGQYPDCPLLGQGLQGTDWGLQRQMGPRGHWEF